MKTISKTALIGGLLMCSTGLTGCPSLWARLFGAAAVGEATEVAPAEAVVVDTVAAGARREVFPGEKEQDEEIDEAIAHRLPPGAPGSTSNPSRALEPGEPPPSIGPIGGPTVSPREQAMNDQLVRMTAFFAIAKKGNDLANYTREEVAAFEQLQAEFDAVNVQFGFTEREVKERFNSSPAALLVPNLSNNSADIHIITKHPSSNN